MGQFKKYQSIYSSSKSLRESNKAAYKATRDADQLMESIQRRLRRLREMEDGIAETDLDLEGEALSNAATDAPGDDGIGSDSVVDLDAEVGSDETLDADLESGHTITEEEDEDSEEDEEEYAEEEDEGSDSEEDEDESNLAEEDEEDESDAEEEEEADKEEQKERWMRRLRKSHRR